MVSPPLRSRAAVRRELEDTYFGQDLDMAIRTLSVDPTIVWKMIPEKTNGKTHIRRQQIDVLNCFIDPSARSLQDVDFAERTLMTKDEMMEMTGWMNQEKAVEQENLPRYDSLTMSTTSTGKMVEVFEFYGKVPKSLITGKKKDEKEKIDARIVVSGSGSACVLHYIEQNTQKDKLGNIIKPYEEGWYTKLPWSWYGISPAWKVLDLQEYINTVVNIRINRNNVAQYGLFKMRAGAGIRQKDFARLGSNGIIKVNNMDDLQQMPVAEVGPGSYQDEETAKQWASEVTSAFDIVRGAPGPASATATGQVLEDRNSKSAFLLIRDSIGYFLQKVIDRHYLPHVPKMIKENGTVRIYSDVDNIDELRERVVSYIVAQELEKTTTVPTEEELQDAIEAVERRLRSEKDLFIDTIDEIIVSTLDTRIQFTNEALDVGVMVRNIIDMMQFSTPEEQQAMKNQVYDMLNMPRPKMSSRPSSQMAPEQMMGGQPAPAGLPSAQMESTTANTMMGAGVTA